MNIEQASIPGADANQQGYRVGDVHFLVSRSRPVGAAASMYGVLVIAKAVNADGQPIIRASTGRQLKGEFTHSVLKSMLVGPDAIAPADIAETAFRGAVEQLLVEMAVEQANDANGM